MNASRQQPSAPSVKAGVLVPVLVPVAIDRAYTYRAPQPLSPGTIVGVPLGPREAVGVVWTGTAEAVDPVKVRDVARTYDVPALPATLLSFVDWVADYTLAPRGMVLRMVLRAPGALEPEKPQMGVKLTGSTPPRLTEARRRVLEAAADGKAWSKAALATAAGTSVGVVDGLISQGALERVAILPRPVAADPDPDHAPPRGLAPP